MRARPGTDDYLGDGVYASWDGWHVILDLRAQDTTTRIGLEPAVFEALLKYRERMLLADEEATRAEEKA